MGGARQRWTARQGVFVLLLLAGLYQLGGAGVIQAKAWLAPVLVERAWQRTQASGNAGEKPWPWADTWPVARLRVPALGVNQLVLAGDSGNALAFGPGHANASASPGDPGMVVISGHRDTHFRFLEGLVVGDVVQLELAGGGRRSFRVSGIRVVDSRVESLRGASQGEMLVLVTCYPFDALVAGGPLRYVVIAEA